MSLYGKKDFSKEYVSAVKKDIIDKNKTLKRIQKRMKVLYPDKENDQPEKAPDWILEAYGLMRDLLVVIEKNVREKELLQEVIDCGGKVSYEDWIDMVIREPLTRRINTVLEEFEKLEAQRMKSGPDDKASSRSDDESSSGSDDEASDSLRGRRLSEYD